MFSANGLQRYGFGARVSGHAVAHARHAVTRRTQTVALMVGFCSWIAEPEPLQCCSNLRLAADDDEDENPLGGVAKVRYVPEKRWSAGHPRDHFEDPRDSHDHYQFQAHFAQRRPGTE